MEFKTKAALAEWANGHTMAEIAIYYNGLEFRVAGRDHADGCPWHSVLFRVAAHRSSAQSQDPFEIEAE
jgi:hypothetical protein